MRLLEPPTHQRADTEPALLSDTTFEPNARYRIIEESLDVVVMVGGVARRRLTVLFGVSGETLLRFLILRVLKGGCVDSQVGKLGLPSWGSVGALQVVACTIPPKRPECQAICRKPARN